MNIGIAKMRMSVKRPAMPSITMIAARARGTLRASSQSTKGSSA